MLDTLFIIAAAVGGTVMVFQFGLTVLGLSDHGDGVGDVADVHAGQGFDGDVVAFDGDVPGDHHTSAVWRRHISDVGHCNGFFRSCRHGLPANGLFPKRFGDSRGGGRIRRNVWNVLVDAGRCRLGILWK